MHSLCSPSYFSHLCLKYIISGESSCDLCFEFTINLPFKATIISEQHNLVYKVMIYSVGKQQRNDTVTYFFCLRCAFLGINTSASFQQGHLKKSIFILCNKRICIIFLVCCFASVSHHSAPSWGLSSHPQATFNSAQYKETSSLLLLLYISLQTNKM